MNVSAVAVVVGAGLALSGCASQRSPHRAAEVRYAGAFAALDEMPSWTFSIREIDGQLAKLERRKQTPEHMSKMVWLYNNKLYVVFMSFIDEVPQHTRKAEVAAQKAWVEEQKKLISEARARSGGRQGVHARQRVVDFTKDRIEEILARMQKPPASAK